MIGISMVAMPILYYVGGNVVALFVMLFIVYWCYGTQLSVNGSTAADFWGTKNLGLNYGMLFTAWGVAGLLGGRIGGDVRQISQLPDGVLHGGGSGGSCSDLRIGGQTPGRAEGAAGGKESASGSLASGALQ